MNRIVYTPEADRIVSALQAAGHTVYYVGGCVRDRLLGRESDDIDIATNASLDDMCRIFPHADIVGKAFSVAMIDGVEVATFRVDGPYSDYRHPDYVHLAVTIEEDVARRDFTINAMAQSPEGTLVDLFNGRSDLEERIIRFVGDAATRIKEDPLRALRACRFAAKIGGHLEEKTRDAIIKHHALIAHLPKERMQAELTKILMQDDRQTALFLMEECSLLPHVLPRLAESVGVPQEGYHKEDCWEHAVACVQNIQKKTLPLRLAALLHDIAKPRMRTRDENGIDHFYHHEITGEEMVEEELRELRYSNDIISYVRDATRYHMSRLMFAEEMRDSTIRRQMSVCESMPIRDLIRLQIADMRANFRHPYSRQEQCELMRYGLSRIRAIEKEEHALKITDLKVNGNDVKQICGLAEGKDIGIILHSLFEDVLEDPSLNERDILLQKLKEKA